MFSSHLIFSVYLNLLNIKQGQYNDNFTRFFGGKYKADASPSVFSEAESATVCSINSSVSKIWHFRYCHTFWDFSRGEIFKKNLFRWRSRARRASGWSPTWTTAMVGTSRTPLVYPDQFQESNPRNRNFEQYLQIIWQFFPNMLFETMFERLSWHSLSPNLLLFSLRVCMCSLATTSTDSWAPENNDLWNQNVLFSLNSCLSNNYTNEISSKTKCNFK